MTSYNQDPTNNGSGWELTLERDTVSTRWLLACFPLTVVLYIGGLHLSGLRRSRVIQTKLTAKSPQNDMNLSDAHVSSCPEVTHVVYIKAPKTGSGTMTSILINFGVSRNLTFALSKTGTHFPMDPLLAHDILPIGKGKHYDLLVHHSTFNPDTIKEAFPKNTQVITSVREPFQRFLSAFDAFEHIKRQLPEEIMNSGNVTRQVERIINAGYHKLVKRGHAGESQFVRVASRLGIPVGQSADKDYIQSYIDTVLEKRFAFALIREYFDESLVLLKRHFNWKLSDIIYLSYHVTGSGRSSPVYAEQLRTRYKHLAMAEYMIYNHFYRRFWRDVWQEGPLFFDEVKVFKDMLTRVVSFCSRHPSGSESLVLLPTEWNSKFTVTGQRCRDMQIDIPSFAKSQKQKQASEILMVDE